MPPKPAPMPLQHVSHAPSTLPRPTFPLLACDHGVEVHTLHQRVPLRDGIVKLIPNVLGLGYTAVFQDDPARVEEPEGTVEREERSRCRARRAEPCVRAWLCTCGTATVGPPSRCIPSTKRGPLANLSNGSPRRSASWIMLSKLAISSSAMLQPAGPRGMR